MKVVTRYAPSPTGPQHIGGIRTALYSYLFARKHGGEFILRIEDTDRNRYVPGAEDYIIEAVKWCGLQFTQGVHIGGPHGPYRQSERSEIYRKYADQLLAEGKAYIAFDTPGEIEEMKKRLSESGIEKPMYNFATRNSMKNSLTLSAEEVKAKIDAGEPHVVRMLVPPKEEIRFQDEIREWVVIHSSLVDDKVLLKSDGMPTYHLANVVDDHLMGVTHVIRGEEWLPSTPLHVLMYRAFGWEDTMPKFAHLPLLLNPDGGKMSKRNADKFDISTFPLDWTDPESGDIWSGYRELGYFPEAFLNFLALLGWNPGNDIEIMSMEEMINLFSLERVGKSGAKFDKVKLNHFQEVYLRSKSNEELADLFANELEKANVKFESKQFLAEVAVLMKERITFPQDIVSQGRYFFEDPEEYAAKPLKKAWKEQTPGLMKRLKAVLSDLNEWEVEQIENTVKSFIESEEVGFGKVALPLRLALTGQGGGPGMFDICKLIGKEKVLARIDLALDRLIPA